MLLKYELKKLLTSRMNLVIRVLIVQARTYNRITIFT